MTWKAAEYLHLPLEAWDLQTCSSSQKPSLNNDQMLKVEVAEVGWHVLHILKV